MGVDRFLVLFARFDLHAATSRLIAFTIGAVGGIAQRGGVYGGEALNFLAKLIGHLLVGFHLVSKQSVTTMGGIVMPNSAVPAGGTAIKLQSVWKISAKMGVFSSASR